MTVSVAPIVQGSPARSPRVRTVAVFLDQRFRQTPDGRVWTDGAFTQGFFDRYLTVFESARVVARIQCVRAVDGDAKLASSDRIEFVLVPHYIGPLEYLKKRADVKRAIAASIRPHDAVILRVPGQVSACAAVFLRRTAHPYAVEVVGDPFDVFAPGAVRHPLRPLFRRWFRHTMKKQVRSAAAASFVTAKALQQRYPVRLGAMTTQYSSVELPAEAFVDHPRARVPRTGKRRLISVGSFECLYKGPDTLLEAGARCVSAGLDIEITFVGSGRHLPDMQALAQHLGISARVRFLGQLPAGAAIRNELDRADLFVLPSRAEGLPRAMIEAMARALPALGSRVGGIPELLSDDELIRPGDANGLSETLIEVLNDPQRLAEMSARNWNRVREYSEEALRERRTVFYSNLRELTERQLTEPRT